VLSITIRAHVVTTPALAKIKTGDLDGQGTECDRKG